jgi:hypothetical protein
MAEAFDRRSLRGAMLAGEIQTRFFDLAAKQSLRQRRTPVDRRCPRQSDELLLLALVQSDRSRMSIGTVCRPACTTRSALAAASVARLHHTQQLHDHTVQP